jgi:hypothetical protein
MISDDKLKHQMQRIADLVGHLDAVADASVRMQAKALIESVMELHGEALERILVALRGAGDAGERIVEALAADTVVSSVLLLYGLHPLDFETRVQRSIEQTRPTLRSYGADADLLSTRGGAVRIRIRGVNSALAARAVRSTLEEALYAGAPDATSVALAGLEEFASPDFVPLEKVGVLAAGKAGD